MLYVSIIIYLVFSLYIYPRIFEKATFSRMLLVFFLCVFSINILVSEILSLLQLINRPWIYLGTQTIICIVFSLVTHRLSPLTIQNFRSVYNFSDNHIQKLEILLFSIISAALLSFFLVGITTPINNIDSLASHLPRIYYWLQQGSIDYWTTLTSLNRYQLIYPINAHIQALWLFLLGQNEYLFFLVQWFSLIIISTSTFEISKSLGFSTKKALISTIIGLSMPVVLLQTFSFQGDLIVTALVMVFVVFLFYHYQTKKFTFLWLAVLSIILALGTKATAFFMLPVSCIAAIILLIRNKNLSKTIRYSWLLIILTLVFSGYQFILNLANTGSVFGLDSVLNEEYPSISRVAEKSKYVMLRFSYQYFGIDGLPRAIQPSLIQAKENLFKMVLNPLGLDLEKEIFLQPGFSESESFRYNTLPKLSEDTAWFGPFVFLLIPLSVVLSLFSKEKLRSRYALLCLINSILYLLFVFIQRPGWDPYQGRYFIISIFPFIPLASILLPDNKSFRGLIIGLLIPASLLLIVNTLLFNDSKPIITARTQNDIINNYIAPLPENNNLQVFIKKSLLKIAYPTPYSSKLVNIYEATYYDQLFYSSLYSVKNIEFVNQIIPEGEPLSILITRNSLEYALFGRNRSRMVNPIAEMSDANQGYLLVSNSLNLIPSLEMKLLGNNQRYSIYYIDPK